MLRGSNSLVFVWSSSCIVACFSTDTTLKGACQGTPESKNHGGNSFFQGSVSVAASLWRIPFRKERRIQLPAIPWRRMSLPSQLSCMSRAVSFTCNSESSSGHNKYASPLIQPFELCAREFRVDGISSWLYSSASTMQHRQKGGGGGKKVWDLSVQKTGTYRKKKEL